MILLEFEKKSIYEVNEIIREKELEYMDTNGNVIVRAVIIYIKDGLLTGYLEK